MTHVSVYEEMLYDVYEYTMGMIEELEKHEDHTDSAENSGLLSHMIPKETKKPIQNVEAKIEIELICLEAQMKVTPAKIKENVVETMLHKTLLWVAARQEKEIPLSCVDPYAKKVVQLLIANGKETSNQEKHQEEQQDDRFHYAACKIRQGQHESNGMMRLVNLDSTDAKFLEVIYEKLWDRMRKALNDFIGLDNLKQQFLRFTRSQLQNERRKRLVGKATEHPPLHLVFAGNPGTGKTTFARRVAELLFSIKKIKKNKVLEVQRSDLVGEYLGHTTEKTKAKIIEARGGVLFVDEAYRLNPTGPGKDFGLEAIEELMAAMEKGDPIMIFAGYEEKMEAFIEVNPGLKSRIHKTFVFPDYSTRELGEMFYMKAKQQGFSLGTVNVSEILDACTSPEQRMSMNARLVTKLLDRCIEEVNNRVSLDATKEELMEIKEVDVIAACKNL